MLGSGRRVSIGRESAAKLQEVLRAVHGESHRVSAQKRLLMVTDSSP